MKKSLMTFILLILGISFVLYKNYQSHIGNEELSHVISKDFFESQNSNAGKLFYKNKTIEYGLTLDDDLQKYIRKLLKRFRTPYSAVVVIDNDSSKVLGLVGYNYKYKKDYDELALSTTNPGASLFKIVTSAALLETKKVSGNSRFNYNGKGTTLYKNQLKDKKNRWTKNISFKKAFAFSNNVIFGKLSQRYLTSESLLEMSERFKFNSEILDIISSPVSSFSLASGKYQLAEFGSGFNKKNTVSPLHAAYLSMIVANNGIKKNLKLIDYIKVGDTEINLRQRKLIDTKSYKIYSESTSSELKNLMLETVRRGTARGVGQIRRKSLKKKLIIGAKTGSITGGFPNGKREWVTAFSIPKDQKHGRGISVAVVNILDKKWYVRSSYIAKKVIEYYFSNIKKI